MSMNELVLDKLIEVLREKENQLKRSLEIAEAFQQQYKDQIERLEAQLHRRRQGDHVINQLYYCAADLVDARGPREKADRKAALVSAIEAARPFRPVLKPC